MKRELTCIVCPMGCNLSVELDGKEVISVKGNTCKRGEEYARSECVSPMRVITSTVRCKSGDIIPVKTACAVKKEMMFDIMREINRIHPEKPVEIGTSVCDNILNTGADVIATASHKRV